jgi:hypothetical protein
MCDAARDSWVECTARARRAKAKKIVQCIGDFMCTRTALKEIAQRLNLTGLAHEHAFDFARVVDEGRQDLGAARTRLYVKHRKRITADIELICCACRNDGRATGEPPSSRQAQAERLMKSGEINRDAVTMRGVVAEGARKQRALAVDMPQGH